jgi:hypothetical protein
MWNRPHPAREHRANHGGEEKCGCLPEDHSEGASASGYRHEDGEGDSRGRGQEKQTAELLLAKQKATATLKSDGCSYCQRCETEQRG